MVDVVYHCIVLMEDDLFHMTTICYLFKTTDSRRKKRSGWGTLEHRKVSCVCLARPVACRRFSLNNNTRWSGVFMRYTILNLWDALIGGGLWNYRRLQIFSFSCGVTTLAWIRTQRCFANKPDLWPIKINVATRYLVDLEKC